MLVIKSLEKAFLGKIVFDNCELVINKGEKMAIIGTNGTGKTTLLRIILGFDDDFHGNIDNTFKTTSYMTQDLDLRNDNKLFTEAVLFDNQIIEVYDRIKKVETLMCDQDIVENVENYQQLLDEYERLSKKFIDIGGHKLEEKGRTVLTNLGFKESQFDQKVETLSGGEKTKLKLAKALICESDLLILDEPTNHLDIGNIVWLEKFLKQYKGSIVIISHDKYLLNRVCNQTALIINSQIQKYKGNYETFYLKLSSLNKTNQKALKKIDQEIERSKKIIKDYKSCFGGLKKKLKNNLYKLHKQLHSQRLDSLDTSSENVTMKFSTRTFIPREFDYEKFENEETEEKTPEFLEQNQKYIKPILDISKLSVKYTDRTILDNLSLRIIPGELVAIIGANGEGKTTLMNAIYNFYRFNKHKVYKEQIEFYLKFNETNSRFHEDIDLIYFDQEYKKLNHKMNVMEELEIDYFSSDYEDMRRILSDLLFNPHQLKQRISTLSGGEKAKLNFAKIMLSNFNLMILDEPTNHLDINTKELLSEALANYNGTVLFVSHDRDFVEKIADRVLLLKDGKLWPISKKQLVK